MRKGVPDDGCVEGQGRCHSGVDRSLRGPWQEVSRKGGNERFPDVCPEKNLPLF